MAKNAAKKLTRTETGDNKEFKGEGIEGKKVITIEDVLRGNRIPDDEVASEDAEPAGQDK